MWQKLYILFTFIVFFYSSKIVKASSSVNNIEKNVNVKAIQHATNINSDVLANINNTTLEIVKSLNRVINVSCDTSSTLQNVTNNGTTICSTSLVQNLNNRNESEIVQVTTSTEMPSNMSKETEWDWSRCREETVPNGRDLSSEQFHPLSAAGGGGGGGGRLRLAVRGDGRMWIYLSREARLDSIYGLYFRIGIGKTDAALYAVDAGKWTIIQEVTVHTDLSSSRWTRVALDVGAGSLEVRVGDAATPLLAGRDPRARLDQLKYIGFDTAGNSDGHATFKFGC